MEAIRGRKRLGKALEIANDLKELGFRTRVRECRDGIPLLWVRGGGTAKLSLAERRIFVDVDREFRMCSDSS